MKVLIYVSALVLIGSCASLSHKEKMQAIADNIEIVQPEQVKTYSKTITSTELKEHLYLFASDDFNGRKAGSEGQKKAVKFLRDYYKSQNIPSPLADSSYLQVIPKHYLGDEFNDTENLLAYIEGTEKPNEVIILSAHHDHEGTDNEGDIYNGADDDGSGTVALMEMAQAFNEAKKNGHGPKRSILFLHLTAEESGLQGSKFYTENPIFPLKNTVANLNIDMIGRVDKYHENNPEYVYLIGSDRLSTELHFISETVNNEFTNLDLNYKYNEENEHNRYYYRSDHYNFAKHNIPVIFYFNGEHEDYHQVTDTPDKIEYNILEKRAKLVFATAWQLANQENRIIVDK
ncbi:M28 family metallopeptidase [Pontimicrobium aquaticum]|uniref:M28 family peptidase n=1 Tax=Pontimicrobium aquaticum TaxID=2565367 RepID=A0A4U0EV88_9FLAO|nr:M28 family metallopeptidase [Pontimicrobium aquaticum]TJY35811.1 M28 family peptidase [Pontimicrobium aquaticum]